MAYGLSGFVLLATQTSAAEEAKEANACLAWQVTHGAQSTPELRDRTTEIKDTISELNSLIKEIESSKNELDSIESLLSYVLAPAITVGAAGDALCDSISGNLPDALKKLDRVCTSWSTSRDITAGVIDGDVSKVLRSGAEAALSIDVIDGVLSAEQRAIFDAFVLEAERYNSNEDEQRLSDATERALTSAKFARKKANELQPDEFLPIEAIEKFKGQTEILEAGFKAANLVVSGSENLRSASQEISTLWASVDDTKNQIEANKSRANTIIADIKGVIRKLQAKARLIEKQLPNPTPSEWVEPPIVDPKNCAPTDDRDDFDAGSGIFQELADNAFEASQTSLDNLSSIANSKSLAMANKNADRQIASFKNQQIAAAIMSASEVALAIDQGQRMDRAMPAGNSVRCNQLKAQIGEYQRGYSISKQYAGVSAKHAENADLMQRGIQENSKVFRDMCLDSGLSLPSTPNVRELRETELERDVTCWVSGFSAGTCWRADYDSVRANCRLSSQNGDSATYTCPPGF